MTSPKQQSKGTSQTINKELLSQSKKDFETERSIKYICLCNSGPEDCLCQEVQIRVTLNTQFCKVAQWLHDNKDHIANPQQFGLEWSDIKEYNLKEKLRTIRYSEVTQKLLKFL